MERRTRMTDGKTEGAAPGVGADGVRTRTAADEARSSHLGFVAHEIRNPLSTALWTSELLSRMQEADRGGARGEKLVGMCLRSLQRVRQLLEDHLLIERIDAGHYPVRPEELPLVDAVVAADGRRTAPVEPVDLAVPGSLCALADRALLARVLDTLLEAAGVGGARVRVEGSAGGGELKVTVRGAPADPSQLDDPTKGSPSDTRGRALALPAARRAAERMGGRLAAREGAWELVLPGALLDSTVSGG
jgi:K+-sensing histidine kinase KdpD